MTLTELAMKYGTDKVYSPGHFSHDYMPFYERILTGKKPRTILEIGIGCEKTMAHVPRYKPGASLRMWSEYFPDAEIFAMDLNQDILINEGNIHSFTGDQSNTAHLFWMGTNFGPFDLIVDDGSHIYEHQVLTARTLLPFLADDGDYIVEDVVGFPYPLEGMPEYTYEQVDFRVSHVIDDRIIHIRRK